MIVSLYSSLNYLNSLLHECQRFEDILLLTINSHGRVLIYFKNATLSSESVKSLMSELHISDYKVDYSVLHLTTYVSFMPPKEYFAD